MNLDQIKSRTKIFIDANIFIYHFTGVSDQCSAFLKRCETKELKPYTSVNVILEVLHRLMMIEVVRKNLLQPPNIVKKLQKNPGIIKTLNEYYENTKKIVDMGIQVFPLKQPSITNSQSIRQLHGLLVNDSLILSTMKDEKISTLATNDSGFNTIENIKVFKPGDLNQ